MRGRLQGLISKEDVITGTSLILLLSMYGFRLIKQDDYFQVSYDHFGNIIF